MITRRALDFLVEVKGRRGGGERGRGRKCLGWLENGRCTLPINVVCWRKSDCCWVEVNLATLTCWEYYQILNIGVFLSLNDYCCGIINCHYCIIVDLFWQKCPCV